MVLDLGVIAHSRIGEETPAIKLSKDEDYANPEAATKMTIEIYRIVQDDPFVGEFEGTSTELALSLTIKFNDYKSMIEFYYDVQEMIDLHQSQQYRKDRTVDDFRFWQNLKVYSRLLTN